MRTRTPRGFTFIEAMVVVAVSAALATAAIVGMRAAYRNATLSRDALDLVVRLQGQRAAAMAENRDRVLVVVDAVERGRACNPGTGAGCLTVHVLHPEAGWSLASFDPANPYALADRVDTFAFVPQVFLSTDAWTAPRPFDGVAANDLDLVTERGGRRCFAIRYAGDGRVAPEFPGAPAAKQGLAFVIGSTLAEETKGADSSGIFVSFPTGIVRTAAFRPGAG